MATGITSRVGSLVTLIVCVCVLVGGAICIAPDWRRQQELNRRINELDQELISRRREISRLRENQRRFKTDRDFLEHIARQEGRVYPGELVFVFEER